MPESMLSVCDVVVIDGRSGSGKTSLATRVAERMRLEACVPQLLRVEDLYPGWNGLTAGSLRVARSLVEGGYHRFDWHAGERAEWVPITPTLPLIIEGCGALTAQNLRAVRDWAAQLRGAEREVQPGVDAPGGSTPRVHSVWLECPTRVRRTRALARDGDSFRPYWEMWARQEEEHYALHRPHELADEVRGAS